MKKVGLMIDDGFHDLEFWIPYYRFLEEGVKFEILTWENREYKGQFNVDPVRPTRLLNQPIDDIDLITRGTRNDEANLMKNPRTVPLIYDFYNSECYLATICHSPLILGKAGLIAGRKITGHPSIAEELKECGATLSPDPYVIDERILSGKTHFQMNEFLPKLMEITKGN
ncbi:MAG: DJ-1/PfpI family protein [Thaumarchaeota archaeon]|nr:DJ-1/PfpI family protein [Nitrososphaerota archaeon]